MKRTSFVAVGLLLLSTSMSLGQDITLRYMMWNPVELEQQKVAIAAFEAAHPGVKVDAQAMPVSDYWTRVSALAAADDLPDVMAMSSGFVQDWADAGNLADLSEYAASLDSSAYFESALNVGRINDGMYAFPRNWVAPVLYYNKDAFDAAGLDYPNAEWTWEQFKDAATALTLDKNNDGTVDQWGYWVYGRYAQTDGWVYRNGGKLLNDGGTAIELNDQAIAALRFLTDLVNVDKVAPAPKDLEGVRQQDVFPLGMAAMWVDGSWNIANARTVAGDSFAWGIAPIPAGPDATADSSKTYAWADLFAVGENSEHKELAWEFIQHMTSGPELSAVDFLGGTVPAYRAIAETQDWLETDKQPDNKQVILEMGEQPTITGFSKGWDAWRGYAASGSGGMNGELDEVFNGRKSLEDAIAAFTAYGNDILSR